MTCVEVHMMQYERNMRAEGREKQNSRLMYVFVHNAPVFNACRSSWPVRLFLVEKCFGSGTRRAHRADQVSRKLNLQCSSLGDLLGGRGKKNLSLFLLHTWVMELLMNVLACCLKDQTRNVLQGQFCILFLLVELHDICCEGAPGVSDQEVQSSYCFWGVCFRS